MAVYSVPSKEWLKVATLELCDDAQFVDDETAHYPDFVAVLIPRLFSFILTPFR